MCDFLLIIDFVVDVDVYYVLCLFVVFGGLVVEFEWWLEWYSYCQVQLFYMLMGVVYCEIDGGVWIVLL